MKLLPFLILASRLIKFIPGLKELTLREKIKIKCSDRSIKGRNPNFRGLRGTIFLNADFSSDGSESCCEATVRTISGRRCQKWNSKSPHEPNKNMVDYLRRHDFI